MIMAKSLQEFLAHYHKQSLLKKPFTQKNKEKLARVNQYEPIFNVNSEMDAIMLDVYYQSTINKDTIQEAIEATRNNVFDIWSNLDNNQKNHLLQVELAPVFASLPSFWVDETPIVVAFFDDLINALLVKRTAVFELPQFFKLYKSYKDRIINPKHYGHLPFSSGFSECQLLLKQDTTMVLYHPKAHVLFEINDFNIIKRFPLFISCSLNQESLVELALGMVDNNIETCKGWLLTHDVLSKAANKASKKKSFTKIQKVI
jgi:hypothetical protein